MHTHFWRELTEEDSVCVLCSLVVNEIDTPDSVWNGKCPATRGDYSVTQQSQ